MAVHPGGPRALVAPHPVPRHQQERRVGDEVEQVVEPAMRIGTAQRCSLAWISSTRRSALTKARSSSSVFTNVLPAFQYPPCRLAGPLRHVRASRAPGLLRGLRPTHDRQPATGLPTTGLDGPAGGRPRMVPTFPAHRSVRSASSSTPAASPRLRRRPSAWPPHRLLEPASELTRLLDSGHALHTGPYPPGWSRRHRYGASTTGSLALRLLTLLAGPGPSGSADPSRRCRGCFPPSPAIPGSGCLQLQPDRCDGPAVEPFHLHTITQNLVAHRGADASRRCCGPAGSIPGRARSRPGPVTPRRPSAGTLPGRRPMPRSGPGRCRLP